jgi:ankyrin repeat protein
VDRATKEGRATALHRAAYTGRRDVIDILLRAGADASVADADGETALHKAAARGFADSCALLLRACPEASEARDRRGAVPLERVPDGDRATRDAFLVQAARRVSGVGPSGVDD